jgi:probable HAF family extracellular repeat protein
MGQVVGRDSGTDGFVWNVAADGTLTDAAWLGDFVPFAINDWGEMAGQQGASAAIAWFEDGELHVEKLPGLFAGNFGRAAGINNFGEVVGVSASNSVGTGGALSGNYRPFLWSQTSGLVPLADSGAALDINDHGQVVGWSFNSKGYYAFLWQYGERMDLFRLEAAEAINNAGQIVGRSGTYKGTSTVASGSYLLTPKP